MTRHLHFDPSREPVPPADAEAALDDRLRAMAAASYNAPSTAPDAVPRDAMWAAIAARRVAPRHRDAASHDGGAPPVEPPVVVHRISPRAATRWWPVLAAMAATLAIGVSIGRGLDGARRERGETAERTLDVVDGSGALNGANGSALPSMLAHITAEHFDRTEALLVSTRQSLDGAAPDGSLGQWAQELLTTTRLLLDTEQLTDQRLRQLLEDLELTLALILQAQASGRATDTQAVRDDLDSGDLLLRVRSAAMPTMPTTDDVRGMSE